jgi:hypothetical protein
MVQMLARLETSQVDLPAFSGRTSTTSRWHRQARVVSASFADNVKFDFKILNLDFSLMVTLISIPFDL